MKRALIACSLAALASLGSAVVFVSQTPAQGGGTYRWSKLWLDPTGQNDLDGDAICYEDFHATTPIVINHMEWWGDHNPNKGFQIEYWRQDPGTIAYQPLAVFRDVGAQPEAAFRTTSYTASPDTSGTVHFSLDLPTPVSLAANGGDNPRWFVSIIGLTDVPYLEWNWAQGLGGSNATFQWIRGGGNMFHVLPEGRAMLLSGTSVPEPAALAVLGIGLAAAVRKRKR